jgi:hypothetical protein
MVCRSLFSIAVRVTTAWAGNRVLAMLVTAYSVSSIAVLAQSLDIGGVELRLGQKVEDALRSLATYEVEFTGGGGWVVNQRVGAAHQLGYFAATAGVVSSLGKTFHIPDGDPAEAYTAAAAEVRRRGGKACVTREHLFTDNLIRGFETQCGPYRLQFFMPMRSAFSQRVAPAMVSIRLHK